MVNFEIVSMILFAAIIGALLLRDRKNITFKYGFITRRWTRGLELIDKLVKRHPILIRRIGNVGIVIGVLVGIVGTASLIFYTIKMQIGTSLILPTAGGYKIPGPVISVPFWYWFLSIFIILVSHETSHAIFARLEKVPVKNYGIFMILLLPLGAFVDLDQERVKRLDLIKKLRIFVAGSLANFIVAIIATILFFSALIPAIALTKPAVKVESLADNSPAQKVGLEGTILKVNNSTIATSYDFKKTLNGTSPGDEIEITTDKGKYQITLAENSENKSYVGATIKDSLEYRMFGFHGTVSPVVTNAFIALMEFLRWLTFLNVAIGAANMLPLKPFDGGLFFGEIFNKIFKDRGTFLINLTTIVLISLLLFNLFGIRVIRSFIG